MNDKVGEAPESAAQWAALAAASREKADAFIEEQTRLTRLQAEDLVREDQLRHWSLRVHHISDIMKLAFELSVALIVLAIAAGIGAAIWNAANDDSLVIEAFSVPPDLAQRGLTGQVVASQLLDKLVAMQNATNSSRPAESYANNWGSDIKVEIPDTGVSIGEAYRYLAGALGHRTRIAGEVYRTTNGVAVTVRAGAGGSATVAGNDSDLDKLLQQSAEKIYRITQPYRYAVYLENAGPARQADARAVLNDLIANGPPRERGWAYIALGNLDAGTGGTRTAIADYEHAKALMPNFTLVYINLDGSEGSLGHDEASLANARMAVSLLGNGAEQEMSEAAQQSSLPSEESNVDAGENDFAAAIADSRKVLAAPAYAANSDNAYQAIAVSYGLLHDATGVDAAVRDFPAKAVPFDGPFVAARMVADYWLGRPLDAGRRDALRGDFLSLVKKLGLKPAAMDETFKRQADPYFAGAMARLGDIAGARALIDTTPLDCYGCLRARGLVEALAHDWRGADYWYARATGFAPSIGVGYSEWGRALLARGDLIGAIAKFTVANQKAPHFADPLVYWGEALMAQNRSDLALAKFEEANKDAPHWGRLHLEWGEAFYWLGQKDQARGQFAEAAKFFLTPDEHAALARMTEISKRPS